VIRVLAPLLVAALTLSACQTTQELSAERAKQAKKLVDQKGLTVARENPDVAVGLTAVLQDRNGTAAVVELRNTGRGSQAKLPVAIAVTDAKGKPLYRNNAAGLDEALVSMPLLGKGEDAFWVNNQVVAAGKPVKVQAKVGAPNAKAPTAVPTFAISRVTVGSDADGAYARGRITNESKIAQRRLTIFCVARRGGRIVAAGRATIQQLAPAGGKPTEFTVFFIGNPKGAKLSFAVPPTVLE
jgi:hypothetical protein